MADLARTYHEKLQAQNLKNATEEDFNAVLEHIIPKLPNHNKHTLACYLKESEI